MPASDSLFISALSQSDLAVLKPFLRRVSLEQKRILFDQGDLVSTIYFPVDAVISLIVRLQNGETVEGAMVGRDGVVGAACALDGKISLVQAVVQIAGEAFSCPANALKTVAFQSESLLSRLIRHEQIMFAESQQSTACMAGHAVGERLARWLLRARDLSGSNTLMLTQEDLADMLGVQRTSVTVTAGILQSAGLIKYRRGKIELVDVEALREAACECYETVKSHHQLMLEDG